MAMNVEQEPRLAHPSAGERIQQGQDDEPTTGTPQTARGQIGRLPSYADVGLYNYDSATVPTPSESAPPDTTAGSHQNDTPALTVDDIGVMLDYTPPDAATESMPSSRRSSRRRRRRRRNRRSRRERRTGIRALWRALFNTSWFGQCISGLFTALMFLAIGIVFLIYFDHLPTYIGVLFILVSLPPFCMAINRYRQARLIESAQRRNRQRRGDRRPRSAGQNDEWDRRGPLPGTDLPPAYNNLGFTGGDESDGGGDAQDDDSSSSSNWSETELPSYDDAVKAKQMLAYQESQQQQNTNKELGTHDNNFVAINMDTDGSNDQNQAESSGS